MFRRLLRWHTIYMHFRGLLPLDGILPSAKFALRPSLAFSYIGSVTARHARASAKLCGVVQRMDGTFAEGVTYIRLGDHHVGHRPTF